MEERINLLLSLDLSKEYTAWDLVKLGCADPIKLFVKNDPHKLSKLMDDRQRLIFSISLLDNILARLLFQNQNSAEKNMWDTIPCKSGMGLHDEGLSLINQCVALASDNGVNLKEADISGWDFSFQSWDFDEDLRLRVRLNSGHGTIWHKIAQAHYLCMSLKVMVFSDGSMVQQTVRGLMPSGWYNTASSNSHCRTLNSYYLQIEAAVTPVWCVSMGDDSVENDVPNADVNYRKLLGKTCKMYKDASSTDFEFCSTRFNGTLGVPVNVDKQLFSFLCNPCNTWAEASSRHFQFCYEMRNHPELNLLKEIIEKTSWWESHPISDEDGWEPLE